MLHSVIINFCGIFKKRKSIKNTNMVQIIQKRITNRNTQYGEKRSDTKVTAIRMSDREIALNVHLQIYRFAGYGPRKSEVDNFIIDYLNGI